LCNVFNFKLAGDKYAGDSRNGERGCSPLFLNAVKQMNDADDKEKSFSSAGRTNIIHPQGCIEVRSSSFMLVQLIAMLPFFKRKAAE
jgi:hypothetical protein